MYGEQLNKFKRNVFCRYDLQKRMAYSGINRSRKLRTHRRQLSDPKIHMDNLHSLREDLNLQSKYGRVSVSLDFSYGVA